MVRAFREIDDDFWEIVQKYLPPTKPHIGRPRCDPRGLINGIEVDVREIKESISELTEKIDLLLGERESMAMMKLSEQSLSAFFDEEPELYTIRDVRVVYR